MRSSASSYSNLFDRNLLPILVYEVDSFALIDANAAAVALYQYSKEELLRLSILDFLKEQEIDSFLRVQQSLLNTDGTAVIGTFSHRMHSGQWTEIAMHGYTDVIQDKNCVVAFCEVISTIEKNENSGQNNTKEASNEHFKALVQESFDMIAIIDLEGNYKYVSTTSSAIVGISPEDFMGRNAFEFIHPDDVEQAMGSLQSISIEKRVRLEPFRFQNKDKEWRWVDTVLTNMLDNPAVLGIVVNSRDVTDKIQERHKLKLLESVITNTEDAVMITEAETLDFPGPRIIYVNEAFTKITGYQPEEVIGLSPRILQGINSNKEDLATLGRALRNYQSCEVTIINYKKDGSEFWVNFTITPISNELGVYTHFIGVQRDVTEQKLIEQEDKLFNEITKIFKEENNYPLASQEICKAIGTFGNFDWIELWTSNIEKTQMQLFAHYLPFDENQIRNKSADSTDTFQFSKGQTGEVWSERNLIYIDDIENSKNFVSNNAHKIGLKSVLGIPLLFNNEVMGVLKVGTKQNVAYLKRFNSLFERLELFLGSELNRKKLENDLSHLFDAIPDILCLVDFEGRIIKMNQAGSDALGYDLKDIVHKKFGKFVHPEDKRKLLQRLAALSNGDNAFDFESRYITHTGSTIWLSWHCNASFTDELIYITGKNITSEKSLRELNKQAARLAKIGNGEINLLYNTIFWSDEIHQLCETDPKTFIPTLENSLSFFREDFRSLISSKVNHCKINGESFDFEVVLITSKKKEKWVRLMGSGEFVDGTCIRIYGSIQDINERKEAEIRLQSLADNLPGVVFQYLLFPDGTDALKFVTKGAQQIWGFNPEDAIEKIDLIWNQIKLGGDFKKVKQSILDAVLTKNKWSTRFKYIMPSGEVKIHLGNGTQTYLTDGTVVFNSLVLDVTNQAENERLLEQVSTLAKIGSWEYNFTTHTLYWSDIVHQIAGTNPTLYYPEIESSICFFTESSRSTLQSKLTECMKSGTSVDFEAQIITLNKKKMWIRILASAEMKNGRCTRIYGSIQDIHNSKSLEIRITEILGSISDGFYAVDKDWKFTYFNKEAEHLLKINEKDIIGRTIWEIFPDVVGTDLEQIYRSVARMNLPQDFEFFFTTNQKWYEISVYPSAGGLAVYFKNIDERRSATERFQDLFAEKNKILESIGDVFYAVDNDWNVTYWNRHAEATFNISKESIIGKNIWEVFPSSVDTDFYKKYVKVMETREPANFDRYSNNMKVWFEVSIFPTENGLSVFLRDVTMKKEGNIELLKANERFEKVTEATNDVIWDWDITNKTYYRSKAIERLFGNSTLKRLMSDEMWQDRFHPEDLELLQESVTKAVEDPSCDRWEMQYRIIDEDQKIIYIEDRGVIVRDDQGSAIRMVGAMTDVSEQRYLDFQLGEMNKSLQQYANELERSNTELEQFAFVASHDLQEPLRMVSSFMDQLKRKYGDQLDEKAHQYIFFATDGAKRMKQIILDLLNYSRASKITDAPEVVNLEEMLSEYKLLRRKFIKEKEAVILSEVLPTLLTYKVPLTQVFHCLLDNSLKYAKENAPPIIEITVKEEEDEWVFSIKDNGIGIEPQFFEKIFIIFQRLHNKDDYEGTGIGLSIAKRHLELLGGRIWLTSKVDEGTTFYFTIPKTS